jgi:hypothetical protein
MDYRFSFTSQKTGKLVNNTSLFDEQVIVEAVTRALPSVEEAASIPIKFDNKWPWTLTNITVGISSRLESPGISITFHFFISENDMFTHQIPSNYYGAVKQWADTVSSNSYANSIPIKGSNNRDYLLKLF